MLQAGDKVVVKGVYKRPMYEDGDFRILCVLVKYEEENFPYASKDKEEEVVIKGMFSAPDYKNQELTISGEWTYDTKYKQYALTVDYVIPSVPSTAEGVYDFCRSVRGIGAKLASRLRDELPNGFVLPDGSVPDADWFIATIKGMTVTKSGALCTAIRRINTAAELTRFLRGCVPGSTIRTIAVRYGTNAMEMSKNTPYLMYTERAITFGDADAIALMVGKDPVGDERVRAGIMASVRLNKARYNAIIALKQQVQSYASSLLNVEMERVNEVFRSMLEERELISADQYCYTREDCEMERTLAQKIASLVKASQTINPSDAERFMKFFEDWKKSNREVVLADKQEVACKTVASNHLSVLTGGPGTGKTTVLKAVVETYKKSFPDAPITLMAPTGLAAKRMSEACGIPALTIHKTLGLVPAETDLGFDDTESMSIEGGLVVVDEVSMVGIHLAHFLFNAILFRPNLRIVLVGDTDQLPPVSPGSVLNDLIDCHRVAVTRLDRNFRQEAGSAIVDAAYAINAGDTNLTFAGNFRMRTVEDESLDIETANILDNVQRAFAWSINEYGEDGTYVLTPKRRMKPKVDGRDAVDTLLSSTYLNPILRDIANPASSDKPFFKSGQRVFRVGDRVINLKNTSEVLNGEIGRIESIEKEDVTTIVVNFDGTRVEYPPDRLKELELAYAITVHKAQGCEYDSVIYPTSITHGPMLQRNLLYTAITRAKKSAVIIGSRQSLQKAICTVRNEEKRDFLSARIQKYAQDSA